MIIIREKWQIILSIVLMQMVILDFIGLFFLLPKELHTVSSFFGVMAMTLDLVPLLGIYEYKEDKEKKKQLERFCNGLSNLKNKIESESLQVK